MIEGPCPTRTRCSAIAGARPVGIANVFDATAGNGIGASRLLRSCRPAQLLSRIDVIRDDLRTALTGRIAFLTKPTAIRSDLTRGQRSDHRRQYLHQSGGQLTVCSVKMTTSFLLAGRRQSEHLSRRHRASQGEQIFGYRNRPLNPRDPRLSGGPLDYTKGHAVRHARLCARAQ